MKNKPTIFAAALLLLMAATLPGCSKESINSQEPIPPPSPTTPAALFATVNAGPQTKVDFEDKDTEGIDLKWSKDDTFTVYDSNGNRVGNFILDPVSVGTASGKFIAETGVSLTSGSSYTAIYPAADQSTLAEAQQNRTPSNQTEIESTANTMAHLDGKLYMEATFIYSDINKNSLSFKHQYTILTLVMSKPTPYSAGTNGVPSTVTVSSSDTNYPTIDLTILQRPGTNWTNPITVHLMILPASGSRELTFKVITTKGSTQYSQSLKTSNPHEAGKRYTATLNGLERAEWTLAQFYSSSLGYIYPKNTDHWIISDTGSPTTDEFDNIRQALVKMANDDPERVVDLSFPNIEGFPDKALINNISEITNVSAISAPKALSIGTFAFNSCTRLTTFDAPLVTSIGTSGFSGSLQLVTINMPNLKTLGKNVFTKCGFSTLEFTEATEMGSSCVSYCQNLTHFSAPKVTIVSQNLLFNCPKLEEVNLPAAEEVGSTVINSNVLTTLILGSTSNTMKMSDTPFGTSISLLNATLTTRHGEIDNSDPRGPKWKIPGTSGTKYHGPFKEINIVTTP